MGDQMKQQLLEALRNLLRHAERANAIMLHEAGVGVCDVTAIAEARAAIAEAEQQPRDGWQPIETAPKDRALLVGYFNRAGKWRSVRGCYYGPEELESEVSESGWAPEGWYEECDNAEEINFTDEPPTHWMPLPAPPGAAPQPEAAQPEACDNCAKLRTVMVAAAEEIAAHWDAHCDAEGYGPSNLLRRLEDGIPSQYGYTAGAFARLKAENEALKAAQPAAEPVAWRITDGEGGWNYYDEPPSDFNVEWSARYGRKHEPLYAAQPQREPQPSGHVRIPSCTDEAKAMATVAIAWLREQAPEELRPEFRGSIGGGK